MRRAMIERAAKLNPWLGSAATNPISSLGLDSPCINFKGGNAPAKRRIAKLQIFNKPAMGLYSAHRRIRYPFYLAMRTQYVAHCRISFFHYTSCFYLLKYGPISRKGKQNEKVKNICQKVVQLAEKGDKR